jgi:hypothetical protein
MNIGPNLGSRVEKDDPIIDRSPEQKRMRVDKLRAELKDLGYSVVLTSYLTGLMVQSRRSEPRKRHKPRIVECLEQAAG